MDDLARGWTIVAEYLHGHHWAVWVAIFIGVWVSIGIGWRQKKDENPDDGDLRPKPRTPFQGSEKDYRR
ncbi:MAG TPA: hypothetical protein VGM26_11770 [Rhizomicrobium sp.]|jgi:hypothetical protein